MASLTKQEIAFLRSLNDLQATTWFLELFEQNPATAIDARAKIQIPFPPGYFDGVTKEQVAKVFGVAPESVDRWTRNGMPKQRENTGGSGNRTAFNLMDCCQWLAGKRHQVNEKGNPLQDEETKFRKEKARMQELRRQQMEGQLVDVKAWGSRMSECVDVIRRGMEQLQRSFGDEVVEALNLVLEEAEEALLGDRGEGDVDG